MGRIARSVRLSDLVNIGLQTEQLLHQSCESSGQLKPGDVSNVFILRKRRSPVCSYCKGHCLLFLGDIYRKRSPCDCSLR